MKRLEDQAKTPQQVFVEALREYREVDESEWGRSFPPGYRTRIAPEFLAEVFASGKKGRAWAREFLRERQLTDYPPAKELLVAMSSLDTIFLVDKMPNAVNQVAVEKEARKAVGLVKAFKDIKSEKDWKKPSNLKEKWKSKVNWEACRRIDHSYIEDDTEFVSRPAEEEIRGEIERDAGIFKACAKVAEWRSAADSAPVS